MNPSPASSGSTVRAALDPIAGLPLILLFLLAGEQAAVHLQLGLPGQIVGLTFLCAALPRVQALEAVVAPTAQVLLRYLPLLILPAGVGSVFLLARAEAFWFAVGCVAVAAGMIMLLGVLASRLFGAATSEPAVNR